MDRIHCLKCVVSAYVEAGRPCIAPLGKAQTRMLEGGEEREEREERGDRAQQRRRRGEFQERPPRMPEESCNCTLEQRSGRNG